MGSDEEGEGVAWRPEDVEVGLVDTPREFRLLANDAHVPVGCFKRELFVADRVERGEVVP